MGKESNDQDGPTDTGVAKYRRWENGKSFKFNWVSWQTDLFEFETRLHSTRPVKALSETLFGFKKKKKKVLKVLSPVC